ncbi:MAG: hypothetical protein IKE52_00980 [Mogibacterium sp.]|nr:hypothetical protein [Mogibacterium sp.]
MRRRRIPIIVLFILSLAAFTLSGLRYYRTLDGQAPVISMDKDEIVVSVKADSSEILKGITAKDDKDGDVTDTLVVEKMSKIDGDSSRDAIIAAFDSRGNITREIRKVRYSDYTHPRFSLSAPLRTPVAAGITSATSYISANDCIDGNISGKISLEYEKPEDGFKAGDYPITAEVVNSAGDKQSINATVTFFQQSEDSLLPRIDLKEYIVYTKIGEEIDPYDYCESVTYLGREYKYSGGRGNYGSDSAEGGNFTIGRESISISGEIDYENAGSQELIYSVRGELGVVGSVRLIVVVEDK